VRPAAAELSENRSDGLSEQSLSEVFRSGLSRKQSSYTCIFCAKSTTFQEVRGNALLFWLLMLYYQRSSLNDTWFPSGIETIRFRRQ